MQEEVPDGYRITDLADYSEAELFGLLKTHWGYSSQPFDIIGRLKKLPSGAGGSFFILEELHSVNDGSVLLYPLKERDVRQTVFVGAVNKVQPNDGPLDGQWVKARVELSPEKERLKHKNPFSLKALSDGLQFLRKLPEEVTNSEIVIDGKDHIEEWIVDFYRSVHRDQITEEGEALREQVQRKVEQEENRVIELRDEAGELIDSVKQHTESLKILSEKVASTKEFHDRAEAEFSLRKNTMESQLITLSGFIEKTAKTLLDLDLVGQKEIDSLLGRVEKNSGRQGHDFENVFSADVVKAISYVQAYLRHKGVIYNRSTLEDFFALLTTHDLIVLAGDSGSGKTNLVKSFADAIGGEAVIIPVKPNWTSAEDLLGYYNPLEKKYLATPFLNALFKARRNPDVPFLICLDEMNLARVEYYFADFLSLMEERSEQPEIHLYSDSEAEHVVSEVRNFIALIHDVKEKLEKPDLVSFLELLSDERINARLHELCGFREGDSLLKYHAHLRKLLSSYLNTPSALRLPSNVRIIGAINVDETTHYLSPKILDRAHVVRFGSPLLADWGKAESEVEEFNLDLNLPIIMDAITLGNRRNYPLFDRNDPLVESLIHLVREYLEPLGIEFGLRTVRQARHYSAALQKFGASEDIVLNNIVLHKVLPKLMFDGERVVNGSLARKDLLIAMRDYLDQRLRGLESDQAITSSVFELDRVIRNAESNDWVVNYWSR